MAIQKLESNTVRTIGASQTLTDPASVIKELLDNALDARATSVTIEIASNTLDIIQVRDNGHGIAPEDRSMVAMPHCTSKLTSEDDIKSIGGLSLGFRGEALASMAEMSGSLTITTRVEGEDVATLLKINQRGEVTRQERASSPVGSLVKITDFIKVHPVRRQAALKNRDKCLKKIKQILQAYAFARPRIRLSFKVLKAKSDKSNWMYAPKPNGTVEEAVLKIVGAACASQCAWSTIEESGLVLSAFIPRPDADATKISSVGAFLSVDTRPVSSSRGTLNQIAKAFRKSLHAANPACNGVREPFFYLEITCTSARYDPNVEPAKDDVIFEDAGGLLAAARKIFAAAYPMKQVPASSVVHNARNEEHLDDFVTSLEGTNNMTQRQSAPKQSSTGEIFQPPVAKMTDDAAPGFAAVSPITKPTPNFNSNMYGFDEDDLELADDIPLTTHTDHDFEEIRKARNDVTVSNPWIMAKMNAPLRRRESETELCTARDEIHHLPNSSQSKQRLTALDPDMSHLPTPRQSSPMRSFHPSDHVTDTRLARGGRLIGEQSLPSLQVYSQYPLSFDADVATESPLERQSRQQPAYDYMLSSQADDAARTPVHAIPSVAARLRQNPKRPQQQGRINKPFSNPLKDKTVLEKVWFDHLKDTDSSPVKNRRPRQTHESNGLVTQGELGDLLDDPRTLTPHGRNRDIRDFVQSVDLTGDDPVGSMIEARYYGQTRHARSTEIGAGLGLQLNDENSQQKLDFVRASELPNLDADVVSFEREAMPKRRRLKNHGPLEEIDANVGISRNEDDEYHPKNGRASSKGLRKASSKLTRTKSSRLPLERIPAGQGLHNVVGSIVTISHEAIQSIQFDRGLSLLEWNERAIDTYSTFDGMPADLEMETMTAKLYELLIDRVSDAEMVQDLGSLVQDAFHARAESTVDEDVQSSSI